MVSFQSSRAIRLLLISGTALLAGCSGSVLSMLENGNPKVCAANEVTGDVLKIIRENARSPGNNDNLIEDYKSAEARWVSAVNIRIDEITSVFVDKYNREISCKGLVHMNADGVSDEFTRNVSYRVQSDLAAEKPIVSVDVAAASSGMLGIITKLSEPEFKRLKGQRDENESKQARIEEETYYRDKPEDRIPLQQKARENLVISLYSRDELGLIDRIYFAHQFCMLGSGPTRDLLCREQERLEKEAKSSDLCSTAGNEWYHCSREDELEQQRAAHRVDADPSSEGPAPAG